MTKALVNNAADESQISEAEEKIKALRDGELADLKALLALPQGRRVFWRLLGKCRVFESIWESSARIHFNAGQQDLGHFITAEIEAADQEALFAMMKEAKDGNY